MRSTEPVYYVLNEGATQEEPWTWEAIEEACRSGRLSPQTRIFLPDMNKWVLAGESELRRLFDGAPPAAGDASAAGGADDDPAAALEAEYAEALARVSREPDAVEAHVEAGRLAVERGDRQVAREHFQRALDLAPFHSRVAKEVMRRFSKSECREFRYLRRDPPAWEDPAEVAAYPLAAGLRYAAIPAAVLFVASFVPHAVWVAAPLAYLWLVHTARHAARGGTAPPSWRSLLANPARDVVLPLVAGTAVAGECALVVYGTGWVVLETGGGDGSTLAAVAESPVLSVTLTVAALAYLPAVLARIVHSVGVVVHLLDPVSTIRSMVRMEQEYAVTALIAVGTGFLLGAMWFVLGGVPLLGNLVLAAAAAWCIPAFGLILGRLAGRMAHVL